MNEEQLERQAQLAQDAADKRDACLLPDGDIPTTDAEAQFGRGMSSFKVIEKLKRLNGLLHFEVSKADPTKIGIYGMTGFIMGMEREESPEFSIRKFKKVKQLVPQGPEREAVWEEHLEFVGEVRGWRTVLARLIRAGLIGQAAAEVEFEVYKGRDSKNWQNLVN